MRYLLPLLFLVACNVTEPQPEVIYETDSLWSNCDLEVTTRAWVTMPFANVLYSVKADTFVNAVTVTAILNEFDLDSGNELPLDTTIRVVKYLEPNIRYGGSATWEHEVNMETVYTYGVIFHCE